MPQEGEKLFSNTSPPPQGEFYNWRADLIGFNIIGDSLLFLFYAVIVTKMMQILFTGKDLKYRALITSLTIFLMLRCAGKIIDIAAIWTPDYAFSAIIKFLSSLAAVVAAAFLLPNLGGLMVPKYTPRIVPTPNHRIPATFNPVPGWFVTTLIALFIGLTSLQAASHYSANRLATSTITLNNEFQLEIELQTVEYCLMQAFYAARAQVVTEAPGKEAEFAHYKRRTLEGLERIDRAISNTQETQGIHHNLSADINQRFAFLEKTINLKKQGRVKEARELLLSPYAVNSLSDIQAHYHDLELAVNKSVLAQADENNKLAEMTVYASLAICILSFLLFAILIYAMQLYHKERARSEEALAKSAELFNSIFNFAFQFTGILTHDGTVIEINDTALNFAGLKLEDVVGKKFWDTLWWQVDQNTRELAKENVGRAEKGEFVRYETTNLGARGHTVHMDVSLKPIFDEKGNVIMIIAEGRDITAVKEKRELALEALRNQERFSELEILTENLPDVLWVAEPNGGLSYVNKRWTELTGMSAAESCGDGWLNAVYPGDRERIKLLWQMTIESRSHYDSEIRVFDRQGELVWLAVRATPLLDDDGNVLRWFGSSTNIQEQKRSTEELEAKVSERTREISQLLTELKESNRELQQFAYTASHDLQEPLRAVAGYTSLLERRYADKLDDGAKKFIHGAVDGAERMQSLINALLSYARVETRGREPKLTDANEIVSQVLDTLKEPIQESAVKITCQELPEVFSDPIQLGQVFQNLLSNALKFRNKEEPQITISATEEENFVCFCVEDNGIGIDKKNTTRIFEMFQRLHSRNEYPGTGIGLAVCKRIIDRHHGNIWVESSPGQGSKFYFTLPRGNSASSLDSGSHRAVPTAD